jgi:hypothetical protein
MQWFRRNVRFGSWCALAALAIQLVLSFGHLHIVGSAAAAAAQAAATEPVSALPEAPPLPSKHPGVADYCTICASIHLAGLLTAEPPSVATLHPSSGVRLKVLIEATTSSYSELPFNARAPPLA